MWDADQYCLDHNIKRGAVVEMLRDIKAYEKAREMTIASLAYYLGIDLEDIEDQEFAKMDADDVIELVGDVVEREKGVDAEIDRQLQDDLETIRTGGVA